MAWSSHLNPIWILRSTQMIWLRVKSAHLGTSTGIFIAVPFLSQRQFRFNGETLISEIVESWKLKTRLRWRAKSSKPSDCELKLKLLLLLILLILRCNSCFLLIITLLSIEWLFLFFCSGVKSWVSPITYRNSFLIIFLNIKSFVQLFGNFFRSSKFF